MCLGAMQGQSYVPELPTHLLDRTLSPAIKEHTEMHGVTLGTPLTCAFCLHQGRPARLTKMYVLIWQQKHNLYVALRACSP